MRKLMKIFMGAAMLALPMMLTSCEGTLDDVLGKWDRPTNNNGEKDGTESEIEKKLVAFDEVIKDGSTFDVTFKFNDKDVTVNFKKENGKYTVSCDDLNPENFKLIQVAGKDLLELTVYKEGGVNVMGQIYFNINDGSYYIINYIGSDVTFDGSVKVKNIPLSVTNLSPDKAVIIWEEAKGDNPEVDLIIRYNKSNGETWNSIADKYALSSDEVFMKVLVTAANNPIDDDMDLEVLLNSTDEVKKAVYSGGTDVDPDNKIGKKGSADYTNSYGASLIGSTGDLYGSGED